MASLRITGGHVIDPANGVDEVRDVWVKDGRIVSPPLDLEHRPDRTIDARGDYVFPGAIDAHCHVVGTKVNAARLMRPEDKGGQEHFPRRPGHRSGSLGSVPSTFATGYRYAGLGYTTVLDAAIAPLGARQAHLELKDTPIVDKAFLVLMGNNHYVMDRIREGSHDRLKNYIAWLLGATGAFGVKAVNPGGVERWKQGAGNVAGLDDLVEGFQVTPRRILTGLAEAIDELGLPHPLHVHGLSLGLPGNAEIALQTMKSLEGRRAHFAHIQFHSYGLDESHPDRMASRVAELADFLNDHESLTADVGQVFFGDTTTMTADGAVGEYLAGVTGGRWYSHDIEQETGCGVVPICYRDKNSVHALQWAIGLEWFLRTRDPWRIVLSTDHPNGGSFLSYPRLMALLMDSGLRKEELAKLPESVRKRSTLGELDREYSLSEIAIITRAAPARILGLASKGHLGIGADADIAIYTPQEDRERMFSLPRYVVKAGEIVLESGELKEVPQGKTLRVQPGYDRAVEEDVGRWFEEVSSVRMRNFQVEAGEMDNPFTVPCP